MQYKITIERLDGTSKEWMYESCPMTQWDTAEQYAINRGVYASLSKRESDNDEWTIIVEFES